MTELRQRQPRLHDPGFLRFIRKQPCCVCGATVRIEAAHIRMGSAIYMKRATGMQEKPDDRWTVPLCAWDHRESPASQHNIGEETFWRREEMNPFHIADRYYREYGGSGGQPKKQRTKSRTRPPKNKRQKIPSRPFPKGRKFNG